MEDLLAAYESLKGTNYGPREEIPIPETNADIVDVIYDSDEGEIFEEIENIEQEENNREPQKIKSKHEITNDDIIVDPLPDSLMADEKFIFVAITKTHSGNFTIAEQVHDIEDAIVPGSLLANSDRQPIARVLEVFGPISSPQIIIKGLLPLGIELFAVKSDSKFANPNVIAAQYIGCDASDKHDEPLPISEQDKSDMEEELEEHHKIREQYFQNAEISYE